MRKREHQLPYYCDLQVLLLLLLVSFLLRGALADEVPEAAREKARSLQGGLNVDGIKVLDVGATSFPAQVSEASCCQPLSNAAPARELHLVAGLRYQLSLWSAAGDLATPASAVRLRLVTGGPANDDSACATGGSRVVTNFGGANSSLNGLGPADAASAIENMWSEARVPFNGSFGLCYLADASLQPEAWLAVRNVTLVAFGAPEAAARHFCLAEVNASCSLQVGLPSAGARLMLIQPGYTCGLPGGRWFEPPFERNISTPLLPGANNSNLVTLHRFGLALPEALEASGSSFRVCVCDTFEYDTASDGIGSCRSAESEDFPQSLGGLLHLVLASALPSNVFQATPFSIEVRCGAAAISGGCAGTTAARIRLVDPAPAGGWGDAGTSSDFCRFASQSNLYDGPSNCDLGGGSGQGSSPPTCHWPPSSASTSLPAWAGVVLRPRLLANVAVPVELGICYCDGSAGCSGDTWFRGGRVTAEPLRFQPQQLIAGVLVNLSLVAPGFSNGSSAGFLATDAAHMLKLIYDPNATLVEGSCATAVPTSDSISNLGCTTPATCRPPSSTSAEVLTWESVGAQLPGLYAACYCQAVNSTTGCEVASGAQGAGGWQLLGWQLAAGVTGVYAGSWLQGTVLYAGSRFELTVLGVGLSNDDRLYFLPGEVACDTTSVQQAVASPQGNSGIAAPAAYSEPLLPRSSAAGEVLAIVRQGLFRIRLVLASAHGLEAGDRVKVNGVAVRSGAKACLGAFSAVLGRQVSHCVEALGSTAGLKVAEVPVSTELVLDLALSTEEVASLDLGSAQWAATSRLLFLGISTGTQASGRYSVCWARSLELSNLYSTCIGFVDIAEPSRFLSAVHPTSVKPNVDIPSILAFQTGNLDAYHESAGPMRLTVVFRDTARLRHAFQASATGALRSVPRSEASQAVCGLLFRELWAESSDGFPQPRGCYYDEELGEYGMVFSHKAGLRPGTRYQVVLMTRISYSLVSEHEWQVQAAATPIPPFSPQEILRTRPDSWGDAGVMPSDLACQEACSMSPSCNVAVWRLDSDRRCFLADLSQRSQPFATEDSLVHSNRTDVTMWMIDRLLSTTVGLANSNGTRNIGLDLWSMDDMDTRPFGVVEVSEAPIAATAAIQRLAGSQRWHETDGLMIVDSSGSTSSEDGVLQLQPEAPLLEIRLRSAFGAAIKAGALVRLFLWPLTQWSLPEESCVAECVPQSPLMSCAAPACSAFPVVTSPFRGGRNVVHLTLPEEMEPITDEVMHTLRLSGSYFPLPPGGFLPSRWAAELRPRSGGEAEAQPQADYAVSVGRLPYATVTVAGGLLSQDGVSLPFAGQADNILYLRFSLGSFLHAGSSGLAAIKFTLPAGYLCKGAGAAPADLATLQAAAGPTAGPQARGELSAGSWNTFSGRECNFTLAPNAVVYGSSSIVVRFLVDNPGTPLSAQDTSNRWGVTVVGPGDSLAALRLPLVLLEGLHSDLLLFPPAVAVLGRVSLTSLTPSNFWWAAPRNLVRVFFRTQQSSGENSGRIQLSVPEWGGFTFQAFCSIMDLPSQYYRPVQGLYGQAATGVLQETPPTVVKLLPGARICRGITVSTAVGSRPSVAEISMTGPLQAATAYAFIIEVIPLGSAFVAQPGTGFHLSTLAQMPSVGGAAGLPLVSSLLLDRTEEPIPLIEATASDLWPSFGVYSDQAEGPPVLSALIANLLPYALTSAASAVAVLLRLPAGVDIGAPRWSTVSWRVMAPTTYVWSFPVGGLFYRQLDVPGTTADLPVIRLPLAPRIEPLNRLDFNGLDKDPLGWQVGETYGFRAGIQVPAETVRHAVNEWVVEWGFDRADLAGRALAAVAPGQEVRTLHSFQFWSVGSSMQGDGTELLFQFGTVTEVPPLVGALLIEAPAGFIFEPACVPFAPRTEYHPYLELPVGVDCVSTEGISYGAAADAGQQPLVTVRPVDGNLPPGMWSFVIACFLPTSSFGPQSFVLRSFKSLGSQVVDEIADVGATAQGLRIGQLLPFAALVSDVDYRLSSRDDHPGLASELIFAFELRALQAAAGLISLEVLAPEGFLFAESCKASIGLGIFGSGKPYLPPFVPFEPGVQIASCTGYRHLAQLQVTPGLQPGRRYAFRLRADQQPAATPVRNEWRVNFGSEASEAIPGFYLWAFSGMALDMVLTTRLLPTVENQVVIVFTPANTIRAKGMILVVAPNGFKIRLGCQIAVHQLAAGGGTRASPADVEVPGPYCKGEQPPTNSFQVRFKSELALLALSVRYRLTVTVSNPSEPGPAGYWTMYSYQEAADDPDPKLMLDQGRVQSVGLKEVFQFFRVSLAGTFPSTALELPLEFALRLPEALDVVIGDRLTITGPVGFDFAVGVADVSLQADYRRCVSFQDVAIETDSSLPTPLCSGQSLRFLFRQARAKGSSFRFRSVSAWPRVTLSARDSAFALVLELVLRGLGAFGGAGGRAELLPVIPRLRGFSLQKVGALADAVFSTGDVQIKFYLVQDAEAVVISSRLADGSLGANFSQVSTEVTANGQLLKEVLIIKDASRLVLATDALGAGVRFRVSLQGIMNPKVPGSVLWTIRTYSKPKPRGALVTLAEAAAGAQVATTAAGQVATSSSSSATTEVGTVRPHQEDPAAVLHWLDWDTQGRDEISEYFGAPTVGLLTVAPDAYLASGFFDFVDTEVSFTMSLRPGQADAGQRLLIFAPEGWSFVPNSFTSSLGFPKAEDLGPMRCKPGVLSSAAVGSSQFVGTSVGQRRLVQFSVAAPRELYAVRLRAPLLGAKPCVFNANKICDNLVTFGLRVSMPATPGDLGRWRRESDQAWLLQVDDHRGSGCGPPREGEAALEPSLARFTNDARFSGFQLKESLGAVRVVPEPHGRLPRLLTTFAVEFESRSELRLDGRKGSLFLRLAAPIGVEFERGCLAAEPDPDYEACTGSGTLAVAQIREATFAKGEHRLVLLGRNPMRDPALNRWTLESFSGVTLEEAREGRFEDVRQRGRADGFALEQNLQVTLRPSTHEVGSNMLLYLWVRPDVYVESLGVLEIHAAQAFSLSCDPKVVLLSIPSGRCTSYGANSGLEIQDWHTVLEFQLNKGDFLLPNNEYELAISARSPTDLPSGSSTSWGVLLRNRLREVLQANMELPSYNLTSYGMTVLSIQPSTNVPYARNQVRMLLSFSHQLTLESISEVLIQSPSGWDFRPVCQLYKDTTGGCQTHCSFQLPYAEARGHHLCPQANGLLLMLDHTMVIEPGVYVLLLAVINPAAVPSQNLWKVSLLSPATFTGWTPGNSEAMYRDGLRAGQLKLTELIMTGFSVGFRETSRIPAVPLKGDRSEVLSGKSWRAHSSLPVMALAFATSLGA